MLAWLPGITHLTVCFSHLLAGEPYISRQHPKISFHYIPNCYSFVEAPSQAPLRWAPGPYMVFAYLPWKDFSSIHLLSLPLKPCKYMAFTTSCRLELHQPRTCWMRLVSCYLLNLTPSFVDAFPIWKLRENQVIATHTFMTCQTSVILSSHLHDIFSSLKYHMLHTDNECIYFSDKGSMLAEKVWHWSDNAEVQAGVGCPSLPGSLRPSGRWL